MPNLDGLKLAQIDLQQLSSSPRTAVETNAGLMALSGLLNGRSSLVSWLLLAPDTEYRQATTAERLLLHEDVGI